MLWCLVLLVTIGESYEQSEPLLTTKQRHQFALNSIKSNSGCLYHPRIVDALEASHAKLIASDSSIGSIKVMSAQELKENMTLANSLHSHTGIMLLPKDIFSIRNRLLSYNNSKPKSQLRLELWLKRLND